MRWRDDTGTTPVLPILVGVAILVLIWLTLHTMGVDARSLLAKPVPPPPEQPPAEPVSPPERTVFGPSEVEGMLN